MQEVKLKMRVECEAWAIPADGVTLEELETRLCELGNKVLEVDAANNRIKVLHVRKEDA